VKIQIELDQITFIQNGNIINLLSVRDSNVTLTQISMNHSNIENVFSEEQVSIKLTDSILHLSNSSFYYVDKKDEQQFINLENSDFTIQDTSFIGGYSHKGGAINIQASNKESSLVFRNSTFSNNNAKMSGGAIYIAGCGLSVFECSFSNNRARDGSGNDIY